MDVELLHSPAVALSEEDEADMSDWNLPLAFMKKRHLEKIEGSKALAQSWRMKDRVSVCVCVSWPGIQKWYNDWQILNIAAVLEFNRDDVSFFGL